METPPYLEAPVRRNELSCRVVLSPPPSADNRSYFPLTQRKPPETPAVDLCKETGTGVYVRVDVG